MKTKLSKVNKIARLVAVMFVTGVLMFAVLSMSGCRDEESSNIDRVSSPQGLLTEETGDWGLAIPTLAELTEALDLREEQAPQLENALAELASAIEARRETRQAGDRPGGGPGGGRHGADRHDGSGHGAGSHGAGGHHGGDRPDSPAGSDSECPAHLDGESHIRPVHQFVLSCCSFLDLTQRGALIAFMAERREAARAERPERPERDAAGRGCGGHNRHHGHHGQDGNCDRDGDGVRRGDRHGGMGSHGGQMGPDHASLMEQLNLTEEQQAAMTAAHEELREAMGELRSQAGQGGMTEGLREQIKALHEQFKAKIAEILTEEQRAQLEALREAQQQARRNEHLNRRLENIGHGAQARLEHLTTILDLSPDQISRIEAIQAQTQERQTALIQRLIDGTLTREEARAEGQQIREETVAQIRGTLSAEQAELFDILIDQFHGPRGHGSKGCF